MREERARDYAGGLAWGLGGWASSGSGYGGESGYSSGYGYDSGSGYSSGYGYGTGTTSADASSAAAGSSSGQAAAQQTQPDNQEGADAAERGYQAFDRARRLLAHHPRQQLDAGQRAGIAERIGNLTRFPSLTLGVNIGARGLSWTRTAVAIPPEERAQSDQEMMAYFGRMALARRAHGAEDLLTALVEAEVEGKALEDWEIVSFCMQLLIAGNETTTHLLGNMMNILVDRPALWRQLRADRSLVDAVIDETLRCESPVQRLSRHTAR